MEPAFQQDHESAKKRLAFKMFKKQSKTNIAKYEVSPIPNGFSGKTNG